MSILRVVMGPDIVRDPRKRLCYGCNIWDKEYIIHDNRWFCDECLIEYDRLKLVARIRAKELKKK